MSGARPIVRWHGGKWIMAPWVISHFPKHRFYVEPFCGAASVLLRKERSYSEVINDLDEEIIGLFRVLRDPDQSARLVRMMELTPFSRREFNLAYETTDDPVERARRLIIRSMMGYGGSLAIRRKSTGFRIDSRKSGSTPARDWRNYPTALAGTVDRLRGVAIECLPAIDVIARCDDPETLFYVDPPYMHGTRRRVDWHCYAHEMTDKDHEDLLDALLSVKGMVVLSGYRSELYDQKLTGWRVEMRNTYADGARKRTEFLWINKQCANRLALDGRYRAQMDLIE